MKKLDRAYTAKLLEDDVEWRLKFRRGLGVHPIWSDFLYLKLLETISDLKTSRRDVGKRMIRRLEREKKL